METGPKKIEDQSPLSPLQTFLSRQNLSSAESISEKIGLAIESGEVTAEEGLDIYKEYTAQLEEESTTDHMTELLNRRGYERKLDTAFESLYAPENNRAVAPVAIVIFRIDINGLRQINEFGHSAGDAAVINVAEKIKMNVRDNDIAARVGGDEFAVAIVLEKGDSEIDVAQTIETIVLRFQNELGGNITPIVVTKDGQETYLPVTATVGYAMAEKKTPASWQELDEAADQAATQRKKN